MRLKNIDELVKYIISENIDLGITEINFSKIEEIVSNDIESTISENEEVKVKISTFFDSPEVDGILANENILFVESVEGNRDICGAGRVNVLGREIMTNLCESDGTAYVKLSIDINGKLVENVQFKLQSRNTNDKTRLHIRKDILDE